MTFSKEKLREARLRLGLTQRDVQAVSQTSLSAIESGRQQPHPSTLRRLAEEYGVEVSDFFDEPIITTPKVALPEDFDVVALTVAVQEENPEVPLDSREFRELVDKRFASELGHLSKAELKAVEEDLQARYKQLDRSFHSPLWSDPEQYAAWLRLWDEIRAVKLALFALDRVLAEA